MRAQAWIGFPRQRCWHLVGIQVFCCQEFWGKFSNQTLVIFQIYAPHPFSRTSPTPVAGGLPAFTVDASGSQLLSRSQEPWTPGDSAPP